MKFIFNELIGQKTSLGHVSFTMYEATLQK